METAAVKAAEERVRIARDNLRKAEEDARARAEGLRFRCYVETVGLPLEEAKRKIDEIFGLNKE